MNRLLTTVALIATLAACSGGGSSDPPTPEITPAVAATPPAATPEPAPAPPPPAPAPPAPEPLPAPVPVPVIVPVPVPTPTPPPVPPAPVPPLPTPPPPAPEPSPPAPEPAPPVPEPEPEPAPEPVVVEPEPAPTETGPGSHWVGELERSSPVTGAVLEQQQALCRIGFTGSLGFTVSQRLSCVLFEGRIGGLTDYAQPAQPRGLLDTGPEGFSPFAGFGTLYNSDSDGVLLSVDTPTAAFTITSGAVNATTLTVNIRIGGMDLRLTATRAAQPTSSAYGPYTSAYWNGAAASLNVTQPPSPEQPGSFFLQGPSCTAQGEYHTQFTHRGTALSLNHNGALLKAVTLACPGVSGGHEGFAFFAVPAFVQNPSGAGGMLVFALTSTAPVRFGYGLRP